MYFDEIKAPRKAFAIIPGSSHFTIPFHDELLRLLKLHVRPLVVETRDGWESSLATARRFGAVTEASAVSKAVTIQPQAPILLASEISRIRDSLRLAPS